MAKSDGTVFIDTKIDTSGIGKGVEDTKKKLSSVSNDARRFSENMQKALSGSESGGNLQATVALEQLQNEIRATESELDGLIQQQKLFLEIGGSANDSAYLSTEQSIAKVNAKLEELRAKKSAVDAVSTSEQIAAANSQMLSNMISLIKNSFVNLIPNLKMTSKELLTFASRGIISGVKKLGSYIKKITSSLFSAGKGAKGANRSLVKMLGTSLLFGTVFRAISALINSFKEGIQNVAQYSDEANASMSALKTASLQLKNSLASAFMPLITLITPALVTFINVLNRALTTIGAFFSALGGKQTFTKAVETQEDYAASLSDTASSAEDAQKELKGYLSPLDEINKLEKGETKTSSGSGKTSPSQMFEEASVGDGFKNLVEQFKQAWANADFTDIGKLLGEKINSALNSINWSEIRKTVSKIGKGIATFFNGAIGKIDWSMVGETIANGLNTAIDFLYELITNFSWSDLGNAIGDFISGGLENIDVKKIANGATKLIKGLLESVKQAASKTNWTELWKKIIELFTNVDFLSIVGDLVGAAVFIISGLVNGLVEAIATTNWRDVWNRIVESFKSFFGIHSPSTLFMEFGRYIIRGLADGMLFLIPDIIDIFSELRQKTKEKFDQIRTDTSLFGSKIKESLVSSFENTKNRLVSIFSSLKNSIRGSINGIIGFVNGLISGVTNGINAIINTLNRLSFSIPYWIPEYGGRTFGFNLSTISAPRIPYLATGAVIPPNAPFMAMLGDQKNGNNLEMPESLLRRIIREETGGSKGGTQRFIAQINRRVLFDEMITEARLEMSRTGKNPFEFA